MKLSISTRALPNVFRFVKQIFVQASNPIHKQKRVKGKIKNVAAPQIAIKYWNMPSDATLRDAWICYKQRSDLIGNLSSKKSWFSEKCVFSAIVIAFQMQPFSISLWDDLHHVDVSLLFVRFPGIGHSIKKIGTGLE